jgi:nucleoid DNA-binding protein
MTQYTTADAARYISMCCDITISDALKIVAAYGEFIEGVLLNGDSMSMPPLGRFTLYTKAAMNPHACFNPITNEPAMTGYTPPYTRAKFRFYASFVNKLKEKTLDNPFDVTTSRMKKHGTET